MIEEPLWVISCPFCEILKNRTNYKKLYWPENQDDIPKSEFIIIEYPNEKFPIVIFRDHIDSILEESWGNILYRCRKIFGESINLIYGNKIAKDHFYCYIKI